VTLSTRTVCADMVLTIPDLTLPSSVESNEDCYVALRDAMAHVTNVFEGPFCGYRGLAGANWKSATGKSH